MGWDSGSLENANLKVLILPRRMHVENQSDTLCPPAFQWLPRLDDIRTWFESGSFEFGA